VALQSNARYGLLIHEVSRSHSDEFPTYPNGVNSDKFSFLCLSNNSVVWFWDCSMTGRTCNAFLGKNRSYPLELIPILYFLL